MLATVMAHFTRRRTLAVGISLSSVGLSSFAFNPLFQLLVDKYTWRGAILILGGLSLNLVPCGALIRPRRRCKAAVDVRDALVVYWLSRIWSTYGTFPVSSLQVKPNSGPKCAAWFKRVSSYLELPLLLERPYMTFVMGITLINVGYFVPYFHLVAHSRQAGFSQYKAAFVMSAAGMSDILGRIVSGWFSDLRLLRLIHVLSLWVTLAGIFIILLPVTSLNGSYIALMVTSVLYGFCSGAMTSVVFAVVPNIVGAKRTMGALGLLMLIESVAGLLGTPLSGRTLRVGSLGCESSLWEAIKPGRGKVWQAVLVWFPKDCLWFF